MRTIETNLYKFEELNEDAQKKCLNLMYDINVNYEWWDFIYYEAKELGFKINSFDIGRGSNINITLNDSMFDIMKKIEDNHGEECDTFIMAKEYNEKRDSLVYTYSDRKNTEVVHDDFIDVFDEEEENLNDEYRSILEEEYLSILINEYDFLTSDKAIIESIKANEYEFNESGELNY